MDSFCLHYSLILLRKLRREEEEDEEIDYGELLLDDDYEDDVWR